MRIAIEVPRYVTSWRKKLDGPFPAAAPRGVSNANTIVQFDEVSKNFGSNTVLDAVSLTVGRGHVLAIVGPSGAGKSTLLRCVNLLELPDSGRITVHESQFDAARPMNRRALIDHRRSTGMVFQSFNLFPHFTMLENVSFAQIKVLGRSQVQADRRSRDLLERVGLLDKVDQYPQRCSGGQQQRAAIARALAVDPLVMLFDEPTSALDPELGAEVLTVMRQLATDGMSMIVVTHEMQFAADVADEVVVMADGRVIEQGVPEQVLQNPRHERTARFLKAVLDRQ